MTNLESAANAVLANAKEIAGFADFVMVRRDLIGALRSAIEPEAPRTDHAANLAKALEHYLNAHDTLSSIQDADEVTGQNDAIDGGFADKANDAWRGMRTALHHYRKHFPENRRAE